ncbi:LmbE family protein [Chromatiales bacterium (ex Bugula neritina AB1)]|nr:LmbE family protein [Chromatiales bacterium (ex Bugula neritina AB1)]
MPLSAQQRITQQQCNPRILNLWRALQPLKSCVSFMNTGAHPDDETSAMLAAISLRDGVKISFACANRGEGGQNNIGTQTTHDLGVIRTAEMEQAADVLGLRLYWLSESPDDSIYDSGFSKSGEETLEKWGYERTLKRFVQIIRSEKPDIICPTFLDIPGQHGHHRAMTKLAHTAINAAADATFTDVSLPVWQVKKMYLPAWSGAGDAYDDDLPPPEPTLLIDSRGEDPVSGWTYEQIGQQSRRFHLTQGMGRWVSPGQERDWPLHLAWSHSNQPDRTLFCALPSTVAEIASFYNVKSIENMLANAQTAIEETLAAFPRLPDIGNAASRALSFIREAIEHCPDTARAEVEHRLTDKERQLAIVIRLATRASARAWISTDSLRAGQSFAVHIESTQGDSEKTGIELDLPHGWSHHNGHIAIADLEYSHTNYPDCYLPDYPAAPAILHSVTLNGQTSVTRHPLESRSLLLPPHSAQLSPQQALLNLQNNNRTIELQLRDQYPAAATPSLALPDDWRATRNEEGFTLHAPDQVPPGLYTITLLLDDKKAITANRFTYPHIKSCMRTHTAAVTVRVLDVTIPDVTIAYVGGGNDQVAEHLNSAGFTIHTLSDNELQQNSPLEKFDTLIIGLFAIRTRPVLQSLMPEIHRWIDRGGNLVTLYHRPWDDWNELTIPPRRLLIGKPSLRWRVTDENAVVSHRLPDHPLLNYPNTIEQSDWQGWHKERGLYFAKEWDDAYSALLSMSDPDETPHHGALLSAELGKGRHTHTSLILHHQMGKLVPGAFRLMANLVADITRA